MQNQMKSSDLAKRTQSRVSKPNQKMDVRNRSEEEKGLKKTNAYSGMREEAICRRSERTDLEGAVSTTGFLRKEEECTLYGRDLTAVSNLGRS